MSALLLSLLLLILIAAGLLMAKPIREHFESPEKEEKEKRASPVLANLLATSEQARQTKKPQQVDSLGRDRDLQKASCPSCPICPDMSQYIRLDEVPCWNCALP